MANSKDIFGNLGMDNLMGKTLRDSLKAFELADPMKGIRESVIKANSYDMLGATVRDSLKAFESADPMRGMRESVIKANAYDVLGASVRDSLKAFELADPMSGMRESLIKANSYDVLGASVRDSLKAFELADPMRSLRESVIKTNSYDVLGATVRDSLKAFELANPMSGMRESVIKANSYSVLGETLKASFKAFEMTDSMRSMRESLLAQSQDLMTATLRDTLKSMQVYDPLDGILNSLGMLSDERIALEIKDAANIHVDFDGRISWGDNAISRDELQNISSQIIKNAFSDSESQIESKIDKLIELVLAQRDPFHHKVLALLIFPIIVGLVLGMVFSVVNPVMDYHVKNYLTSNEKKSVVKEVRAKASSLALDNSYFSSFKIVSADTLNVRQVATNKSSIVGILHFGCVVEVLEKNRSWSLVSWHDSENDIVIQGWVYSRYLKKLN